MKNLTELAIFAQVVESKSFSLAAAQLGLSKSAVSKHITQLEAYLVAPEKVRSRARGVDVRHNSARVS